MLLPNEYQQVEYIQTSGTQFIDTGITPQSNIQIETKVSVVTTSQNLPVFGNYVDNSVLYIGGEYYHLTCYGSKWYWGLNGSESNGGTYSTTVGTQYEIIYNNSDNQILVNGSSLGSSSGTAGYTGTTLAISVRGNNYPSNKFYGQYKYYYFNVFNKTTGEYERQMIPCYRKSDGEIGMYDLVNSVFYTNDGTGTFTKGADINGSKIKRGLIRVNGVEKQFYPAEGWKPNANTLLYLPLENNAVDKSGNSRTTSDSGVTYTTISGVPCAYFGANGGVNITNDFISTTLSEKTISAWVNVPSQTTSTDRLIFYTLRTNHCFCGITIGANSSNISSWVSNGTNVQSSFTAGQWFYITCTGSSTETAIYINGQKVNSGTGDTYPRGTTSANFNIGTRVGATHDGRERLNGYISNFILESKARTADEVSQYYNQTKGNYGL